MIAKELSDPVLSVQLSNGVEAAHRKVYSAEQRAELAATVHASGPELVVDASLARVASLLDLQTPAVRVSYAFRQLSGPALEDVALQFLRR